MTKLIFLALFFVFSSLTSTVKAQQNFSAETDLLLSRYKNATAEEKILMDSVFSKIQDEYRGYQIKSICGVDFGMTREEASEILRNKFGAPIYNPNDNIISYEKIKYGGIDFDFVHFNFQSDGKKTYLNSCIFVKDAKDKTKAEKIIELYRDILSKKYKLVESMTSNGFKCYGGGVSPLWDGHWVSLSENKNDVITGVSTDVIEYEEKLIRIYGNRYGVRLIYGPYQYVKEEF